jgi:pSer/pThr/pTyr-binding forkhead associated (FHA) protein
MITLNIDNKKKLDFTEKLIKIGRNSRISEEIEIIKDKNSEGVNLFLKNKKALSREHCEIFEKDFQWYIKDLQSANGTYLNNRRIESLENYPLRDGDSLLLSKDVSIIVSLKDKEETVIDIGQENEDATLINNVFIDIKEITDDIITRKVTNKIYYLEAINNKYKSYAFILDFSRRFPSRNISFSMASSREASALSTLISWGSGHQIIGVCVKPYRAKTTLSFLSFLECTPKLFP